MKKMYNTTKPKAKNNRITISIDQSKVRNEMHFLNCLNSNVAYVSKDKKKIIPRKQKYKKFDF